MSVSTLWSANPNSQVTLAQGNIGYDDVNTTYDAAVYYDGAAPANLTDNISVNPALYTTAEQPTAQPWTASEG
jgi:hypothetical protein